MGILFGIVTLLSVLVDAVIFNAVWNFVAANFKEVPVIRFDLALAAVALIFLLNYSSRQLGVLLTTLIPARPLEDDEV